MTNYTCNRPNRNGPEGLVSTLFPAYSSLSDGEDCSGSSSSIYFIPCVFVPCQMVKIAVAAVVVFTLFPAYVFVPCQMVKIAVAAVVALVAVVQAMPSDLYQQAKHYKEVSAPNKYQ